MKITYEQELTPEEISAAFDAAWTHRDVDALLALYARDATVESPLIPHLMRKRDGVCRGRDEIRALVEAVLARDVKWGRHEAPVVRGNTIFVEYRRVQPGGEQLDYVDVFEVSGGLIQSLRAYWGWRALAAMTG
jgi:ketosteroid isomerase-like protein